MRTRQPSRSASWSRVVLWRCMTGLLVLVAGGLAITATPSVAGAVQEPWTPSQAPLPTAPLPNGNSALSMMLNATSCSSASFCVAAGWVSDGTDYGGTFFPLVETYTNGSWAPTVLPLPPNARPYPGVGLAGSLTSVSCGADGSCAAVGDYSSSLGSDNYDQSGLLEQLSDGVWTATEAPLPFGESGGLPNLNSVSCSDVANCVAVGSYWDGSNQYATSYTLNSGVWQMKVLPVPAGMALGAPYGLNGVSCPDDGFCVAVGDFGNDLGNNGGLIATLQSGAWSETEVGVLQLNAVDCPEVGSCVAGGAAGGYPPSCPYGYNGGPVPLQPAVVQEVSGSWTLQTAPIPSDAGPCGNGEIEGMFCPAVGACVATGNAWALGAGDQNGMILTQANGTWSAADAPLPGPIDAASTGDSGVDAPAAVAAASTAGSSLAGVACGSDGFCAAAGGENGSVGLVETSTSTSLPSVTGVAPGSGPLAGGTAVTITGSNFTTDSVASFGGVPVSTTYVSSSELQATAPAMASADAEQVDVTVTSDSVSSRANPQDVFGYTGVPPAPESLKATSVDEGASLSWSAPWDGGSPITGYVVNEYAGLSATGPATVVGTESTAPIYTATGLTDNEVYTFTVQAENGQGPGGVSTPVTVVAGLPLSTAGFTSGNSATATTGQAFTFVMTTGSTTAPLVTEKGRLPSGVSFKSYGNSIATMSGTPTPGAKVGGIYPLVLTATYGTGITKKVINQNFTFTVLQSTIMAQPKPVVERVGATFAASIAASGYPKPGFTESGGLPGGVTFVDGGNGIAHLEGTLAPDTQGTYPITVTASNGVGAPVSQTFSLTVYEKPVFTSATSITVVDGTAMTFTVTADVYPAATFLVIGLPHGLSLLNDNNGTATIHGTTTVAPHTYPVVLTARSKSGTVSQRVTLTVVA